MKLRAQLQIFNDGRWTDVETVMLTERGADRPFSSGKFGYNGSDKVTLPAAGSNDVNDVKQHQFTLNVIQIEPKAKE